MVISFSGLLCSLTHSIGSIGRAAHPQKYREGAQRMLLLGKLPIAGILFLVCSCTYDTLHLMTQSIFPSHVCMSQASSTLVKCIPGCFCCTTLFACKHCSEHTSHASSMQWIHDQSMHIMQQGAIYHAGPSNVSATLSTPQDLSPPSTSAQALTMPLPDLAAPGHHTTPKLDRLPMYGPRLPIRPRHQTRPCRQRLPPDASPPVAVLTALALSASALPDGLRAPSEFETQGAAAETPPAKRIKQEQEELPSSQSPPPITPEQTMRPSEPMQSDQPPLLTQPLPSAHTLPQAHPQRRVVNKCQQQQHLDLFGPAASLDVPAKQAALEQLINFIAGGM